MRSSTTRFSRRSSSANAGLVAAQRIVPPIERAKIERATREHTRTHCDRKLLLDKCQRDSVFIGRRCCHCRCQFSIVIDSRQRRSRLVEGEKQTNKHDTDNSWEACSCRSMQELQQQQQQEVPEATPPHRRHSRPHHHQTRPSAYEPVTMVVVATTRTWPGMSSGITRALFCTDVHGLSST